MFRIRGSSYVFQIWNEWSHEIPWLEQCTSDYLIQEVMMFRVSCILVVSRDTHRNIWITWHLDCLSGLLCGLRFSHSFVFYWFRKTDEEVSCFTLTFLIVSFLLDSFLGVKASLLVSITQKAFGNRGEREKVDETCSKIRRYAIIPSSSSWTPSFSETSVNNTKTKVKRTREKNRQVFHCLDCLSSRVLPCVSGDVGSLVEESRVFSSYPPGVVPTPTSVYGVRGLVVLRGCFTTTVHEDSDS